jgi:pilus assembly protein Flp/PilA
MEASATRIGESWRGCDPEVSMLQSRGARTLWVSQSMQRLTDRRFKEGNAVNLTWLRQALSICLRRGDDERGQGMVEYALIPVLIAMVVIVVVQVVGQQTNNVFSNVANGLSQ